MALAETGKTWQFDLSANKAGVVIRIELAESYDTQTAQHVVTVTGLYAKGTKGSSWYGVSYFLDGSIAVDGLDRTVMAFTKASKDYYFWWGVFEKFEPVDAQYSGPLKSPLEWESDPFKADTIKLNVNISGYTASGQYGSGWKVSEVLELELTELQNVPDSGTVSVRADPHIGFFYNGKRVVLRYAGRPIGAFVKPVVIDPTEAILGTGVLGQMILGKEN